MNVNDECWVRLTEAGEKVWAKAWEPVSLEGVPKAIRDSHTEKDGRIRFQLWDLMHTFGPVMFNGSMQMPFKSNIVEFE